MLWLYLTALSLASAAPAFAQLNGQNIKGDAGLKSGSQAPPGVYFAIPLLDFDSNPGAGLTDLFVQPVDLGWHLPHADLTAVYGLFIPTGRYEDGASNNTGLGMWAQELRARLGPSWRRSPSSPFRFLDYPQRGQQ
jgi:hypothetical protein